MTILFDEPTHKYFCVEKPDKKFVSVSGLYDMVKQKFDSIGISETYAKKGKQEILKDLSKKWKISLEQAVEKWGHLEFTPEDIRKIWSDKSTQAKFKGTAYHKAEEEKSLKKGAKRGTIVEGEYTRSIDLSDLKPGEYTELIIPYVRQWLIGTADKIIILPNREFIIRDFKTDKELLYKGTAYFNPKTKQKEVRKLLPPLSHLDDVNGIGYNIKESLYIYFLESYGYKFKEGWIDHVQFDDNDEPIGIVEYPIEYMKKEVINLLNWYKTKQ